MTSERAAREPVLPARRREAMLALVQQAGQATVSELAARFDVSFDTVRRDIDQLADAGLLARTHGGAVPTTALAAADSPLDSRMLANQEAKRAIAREVPLLIQDGETVIVNGGTTTLAVAAVLGDRRDLTIVTNNILLPQSLPAGVARDVLLVGGSVRLGTMTTTGPVRFPASDGLSAHAVSADVAILGVGGVTARQGLSTSNLQDAQMMRDMVSASSRLIAVADATKIGHDAFAQICPLSTVDHLVSDITEDHPVARALIESGGQLVSVRRR